jgi:putative OPT family oligopeptide transporter
VIGDTEKDLSNKMLGFLCLIAAVILFFYLYWITPYQAFHLGEYSRYLFIGSAVIYILLAGFIFANIGAYFSGLVGNSASPGSAILIGCILLTAFIMHLLASALQVEKILIAEGLTIIIATVSFGAAAIANDNSQDLKVGHLIGATPWKQEIMLILGAIISALVIPMVMQLLFSVYGIADVIPRKGMDIAQTLPAPPAAATAAITQGVFSGNLPWDRIGIGAIIMLAFVLINFVLKKRFNRELTLIGMAIGIYLPLATSSALFFGGLIAWLVKRKAAGNKAGLQKASLMACGLVAGSALMDVILAIPFAFFRNANIFAIPLAHWQIPSLVLSALAILLLVKIFYRFANR